MSCSIEARVPYTDYRLVDYLAKIPFCYKIHNGWSKWLLREAAQDLLPHDIIWRKDKLGFATPQWVSRDEFYRRWKERDVYAYYSTQQNEEHSKVVNF